MNSALKEAAVTRFQGPLGGTWTKTNNIWIWVVLIFIFFAFANGDGFGFGGNGCGSGKKHHHKHRRNNNGFFGENGWFILIIFAALFLLNDGVGGANTNIINVDTEDAPTC